MSDRPIIDLRSDTVTTPSPEMRQAMADAQVGDDVMGEDPTIRRLEELSAEHTGKEAGLFVASGTMSNLVAILAHCGRGDEAIVGDQSHIIQYEVAGAAGLAAVQLRQVTNTERGSIDAAEVEALIRGENVHHPATTLLCIENTQNRCGGAAISLEETQQLADVAHEHGLRFHIDGARIFNAALALGVSVPDLCGPADSIGFCLSKGLGAPVGSVVCGDGGFIARARKMRKMVGGGLRQGGIIAAAGIYALEHMVERLAEDHANAKLLAHGLSELPGLDAHPDATETNIVMVGVDDAPDYARMLKREGVLCGLRSPTRIRMVTHYGIDRADIEQVLERARNAAMAVA
jgi:threonine aldolase